jgi:pimeloyl-ACP methyl ester carboxylesterase
MTGDYDEFGLLDEAAREAGLPSPQPGIVERRFVAVEPGRHLSALVWSAHEPDLVLLHGGRQNAHTWDTVALALDRPLVAVDLPGHGHSDGAAHDASPLDPRANAKDVAAALRTLAPAPRCVVGMSLGGLTAIALTEAAPDLVQRLVLVDVLPGLRVERAKPIADFINGPSSFRDLDELLMHTARANPTRSLSSLRRGILHNAEQQTDGSWQWRWARHPVRQELYAPHNAAGDRLYEDLWPVLERVAVPILLVRGLRPDSVLRDADEQELQRRVPAARVVQVAEAGHSLQGDTPVLLAKTISDFLV